jgi:hypothetical protein
MWTWAASPSPDVAMYVLFVALFAGPAQPGEWVRKADTPTLSLAYRLPVPPVGSVTLLTVEAQDWAGNVSWLGGSDE